MRSFKTNLVAAVALAVTAGAADASMKNGAELNFGSTHPGTVTATQTFGAEQRVDPREASRMIPGSMRPGVTDPSLAWGRNYGQSAQSWDGMTDNWAGFTAMRGIPSK